MTTSCNPDGSCPPSQSSPDSTSCNSVPFGICQSGTCVSGGASGAPTKKATHSPTQPFALPTSSPSTDVKYCGCDSCTQLVWNTIATDSSGSHSCGGRITWLQSAEGYSEDTACAKVASEFPDLCLCDPNSCADTPSQSMQRTASPSMKPTAHPSVSPPTAPPSKKPTAPPTVTYCGCDSCTQEVWDIIATDNGGSYSCGARISWLQSAEGYSEVGACEKVASEFSGLCLCGILPSS